MRPLHFPAATSEREFLCQAGGGFGALALSTLLPAEAVTDDIPTDPLGAPFQPFPG